MDQEYHWSMRFPLYQKHKNTIYSIRYDGGSAKTSTVLYICSLQKAIPSVEEILLLY